MLTKENFKIDFIVPHLNNPKLRKSLETLRTRTPKENMGKIILMDCNPDGYQQVDDLVNIHVRMDNQGFARNNNLGIRLSDADFVACMNDDVELIHPKWIEGIIETFNRYDNALCVSPSSPRNPRASGAEPIDHVDFPHKEEWTEAEYDALVKNIGQGHIYDGICMYFPIFRREILEKIDGVIPGKCWFNEAYLSGGGEDYHMNYAAYTTKNDDNNGTGYRCLGSGLSYVYHWWYSTKRVSDGIAGVKYDNTFNQLLGKWEGGILIEAPDVYGKKGIGKVPMNVLRK